MGHDFSQFKMSIILRPNQQLAFDQVMKGKNVIIVGKTCTGKSVVINEIISCLQMLSKRFMIVNDHIIKKHLPTDFEDYDIFIASEVKCVFQT